MANASVDSTILIFFETANLPRTVGKSLSEINRIFLFSLMIYLVPNFWTQSIHYKLERIEQFKK